MKKFLFAVIVLSLNVSAFAKDLTAECTLRASGEVIKRDQVIFDPEVQGNGHAISMSPTSERKIFFEFTITNKSNKNEVLTRMTVVTDQLFLSTNPYWYDVNSNKLYSTTSIFVDYESRANYSFSCSIK